SSRSGLGPHALAYQTRQHLVAEIGHLAEIIDEGEPDAAYAGLADNFEFFRHVIGRADERIAADGVGSEIAALGVVFVGGSVVRRDIPVRQHAVDRTPIGVVDIDVAIVLLGLLLRRTADDLTDSVDLDLAAEILRGGLGLRHLGGAAGK